MRIAEAELSHQELTFLATDPAQFHLGRGDVSPIEILDAEVVRLPGFRGEMVRCGRSAAVKEHGRLPFGAEMMIAGINGEVEIAVALRSADPIAVQAPLYSGAGMRFECLVVLQEINERFASLGLADRMAGAI